MPKWFSNISLYKLLWLLTALVTIAILIFLFPFYSTAIRAIGTLCLPFVVALILAYLFHPLVHYLSKWRIPRSFSIMIIFLLLITLIILGVYQGTPFLTEQWGTLSKQLPIYQDMIKDGRLKIYHTTPEMTHPHLNQLETELQMMMTALLKKMILTVKWVLTSLFSLLIIPFVCFYFLKDYHRIGHFLLSRLPQRTQPIVKSFIIDVDETLGHFLKGQLYVSVLLGILSVIGLWLIHCPHPVFLSVLIAVTDFIPFFGPFIAAIPVFLLASTKGMVEGILAIIVMIVLQFIEGNLLSPIIMGKSLAIHPLWIIILLFVSGEVAGILGMLFAVPLFIIIKCMIQYGKPFFQALRN